MAYISDTVKQDQYLTDRLTTWQQITYTLSHPLTKGWIYIASPIAAIIFPPLLFVSIIIMIWMWLSREKWVFPARIPREANRRDKTDPGPGGKGYRRSRGEMYLGNHRKTGKELWTSFDDMLTHLYMLAATGGGKSQAIWSILANFLAASSGFSLTDGKGTLEMSQHGRVLARRFGLEDQYFVVNYMSGDSTKPQKRMSNSINTFTHGNAAQIKEQISSLALSGDAGQNQYFEDNAAVILERGLPAIVELRDKGMLSLDIQVIGRYLQMDGLYELYTNENVSKQNRAYVKALLTNIGFEFDKAKAGKPQNENAVKMYGQFVSHFAKIIASLSIQYRGIFVTDQSDINPRDILSNRRLMISTLPSLEKSGSELKNLGNIVLTAQKNSISADLGDQLEGSSEETLLRLSTSWQVPYALTYDEWATFSIKDIFLIPAQVRGIKYCGMFFAQDYAGTEGAGEKDAEQVFANCRVKFFGALEEAGKSWTRIRDLIGESLVAVNSNYRFIPGMLTGRYVIDREKTEITRRAQIEIKDLQEQVDGQMFIFVRGRLSPITFYFSNIKEMEDTAAPGNAFKINRFLRVYPPLPEQMEKIERAEKFVDVIHQPDQLYLDAGIIRPIANDLAAINRDVLETQDYIHVMSKFLDEHAMALNLTISRNRLKKSHSTPAINTTATPSMTPSVPFQEEGLGHLSDFDIEETEPNPEPTPVPQQSPTDPIASPTPLSEPMLAAQVDMTNDLAKATREAKEAIKMAESPPSGAHILSIKEADSLKSDISDIGLMIGYPQDLSSAVAQKTIDDLERHCYYLAPPKPHTLNKDKVLDLDKRVDKLLNQSKAGAPV